MFQVFKRMAVAFAAVLALSACASQTKIPPEKLAGIKSIAVVSATGDRLNWQAEAALALFDRERKIIPVSEWGADARIEKAAAASLQPRYTLKALDGIDRKALAAMKEPEAIAALRKALTSRKDIPDAVLLIREATWHFDRANDAPPRVTGVGLYRKGSIVGPTIVAHACLNLVMIETKSFNTISSFTNSIPDAGGTWPHMAFSHGLRGSSEVWADRFEDTPPDQKARIQNAVYYLIDRSFPRTFQRHGLIE